MCQAPAQTDSKFMSLAPFLRLSSAALGPFQWFARLFLGVASEVIAIITGRLASCRENQLEDLDAALGEELEPGKDHFLAANPAGDE